MLTIEQIQKTVSDYFKDKPVKRVYLFGSYARGDEKRNSDIDLMVDLDYSKKIGLDFVRWGLDLEKLLGKKIDLVPEDCAYESVKVSAEKDRQLVLQNQYYD